MFDRVLPAKQPKRWKTVLLLGTVGGHAAVLVALVAATFWKIDKLPVNGNTEVRVAIGPQLKEAGSPPAGKLDPKDRVKPPKVKPPVPVQPTVVAEVTPATGPAAGSGETAGDGTGTGTTGGGGGGCTEEPCGNPDPDPEPEPDPPVVTIEPPRAPPIVPPDVAAGLRLSGTESIRPPDSVRVAMVHAGQDTVRVSIKLCVDAGGSVSSVKLLGSTGHDAYDSLLAREMKAWRYRPYKVNGVETPMCTVQMVIYRMKK